MSGDAAGSGEHGPCAEAFATRRDGWIWGCESCDLRLTPNGLSEDEARDSVARHNLTKHGLPTTQQGEPR